MSRNRFGTVPVDKLSEEFFVRIKLNTDHVRYLQELYENNTHLPALLVTRDFKIIDGRHRYHALLNLGKKSADVEFTDETDHSALVALALLNNAGGPLPPSHADIIHSIKQMLDAGTQGSVITKSLTEKWPVAVVRKYLEDARSELTKDRVVRAIRSVVDDGKTVAEAALLHSIKVETLRNAMGSKKKKKTTVAETKASLTTQFRSHGQRLKNILMDIQDAYEEGSVSKKDVISILSHIDQHAKRTGRFVTNWEKRLGVTANGEPIVKVSVA